MDYKDCYITGKDTACPMTSEDIWMDNADSIIVGVDPAFEGDISVMIVSRGNIVLDGYDYSSVNVADTEQFDYDSVHDLCIAKEDDTAFYDIFEAPPIVTPTDKESGVNEALPNPLSEKEKAIKAYHRAMKIVD